MGFVDLSWETQFRGQIGLFKLEILSSGVEMATFKATMAGPFEPHGKLVRGYNKGYNKDKELFLPSS